MKNKKAFFTTKWITYTAMLTALVIATSYFIPPLYIPGLTGRVYWCDCIIFIAAFLLDPIAAFVVGGMGTFIYDVIIGNAVMAPVSLIIHGIQAAAVSALLQYVFPKNGKKEPLWASAAAAVGALAVIGGYFLYYWLIAPLMFPDRDYGIMYAAVRIPRNIIQEIVGIAVAMIICYATTFKKQLEKAHLLPDFKGEILKKEEPDEQAPPDETNSDNASIDEAQL